MNMQLLPTFPSQLKTPDLTRFIRRGVIKISFFFSKHSIYYVEIVPLLTQNITLNPIPQSLISKSKVFSKLTLSTLVLFKIVLKNSTSKTFQYFQIDFGKLNKYFLPQLSSVEVNASAILIHHHRSKYFYQKMMLLIFFDWNTFF